MNYIERINKKKGKVLRLNDICDSSGKIYSDICNLINEISDENYLKCISVIQSKGLDLINEKAQGTISVLTIDMNTGVENYLQKEGVGYYLNDKGIEVFQNSSEAKYQDYVVKFSFVPNHKPFEINSFNELYSRYLSNMSVKCYLKHNDEFLPHRIGDYDQMKDFAKEANGIVITDISI